MLLKRSAFAGTASQKKTFTVEEVAKHNTREDVWVILKGKVHAIPCSS
jgi:cytochrome b involved in lipid metabolism